MRQTAVSYRRIFFPNSIWTLQGHLASSKDVFQSASDSIPSSFTFSHLLLAWFLNQPHTANDNFKLYSCPVTFITVNLATFNKKKLMTAGLRNRINYCWILFRLRLMMLSSLAYLSSSVVISCSNNRVILAIQIAWNYEIAQLFRIPLTHQPRFSISINVRIYSCFHFPSVYHI